MDTQGIVNATCFESGRGMISGRGKAWVGCMLCLTVRVNLLVSLFPRLCVCVCVFSPSTILILSLLLLQPGYLSCSKLALLGRVIEWVLAGRKFTSECGERPGDHLKHRENETHYVWLSLRGRSKNV